MKSIKRSLLVILLLLANLGFSKSLKTDSLNGFWGINFGTSKNLVITKMKSRGIILKPSTEGDLLVNFAQFGGRKSFLILFKFYGGKLYRGEVFYETDMPKIRDDFNSIKYDIDKKYYVSETEKTIEYPYKGDPDYEELALSSGYGKISTNWHFENASIRLQLINTSDNKKYLNLTYIEIETAKKWLEDKNSKIDF